MLRVSHLRTTVAALFVLVMTCCYQTAFARSASPIPPQAVAGVLETFRQQPTTVVYVTLTGATGGSVWGSGPYTFDSNLAAAAVHAGVLAIGATGTVKVTVLDGQASYSGSLRNGISSSSYGAFPRGSFLLDADDGGDNPILQDPGNLQAFQSGIGGVHRFKVTGSRTGGLWGTNAYTTDSTLAVAVVHAGVLGEGQTGFVRVVIAPAQTAYIGSLANGVSSISYGQYVGGYAVSNLTGATDLIAYPGMMHNALADPGSLSGFRGRNFASQYFKVTGAVTGGVWGTGVYTDDSNLATAAVHAGVLAPGQQGLVKVTIRPGLTNPPTGGSAYVGSAANGVVSNSYGSYAGSYSVSNPDGAMGVIPRSSSPTEVSAELLKPFSYAITAKLPVSTYNATGLPAGLSVDPLTGVIAGVPELSGNFLVQLLLTNPAGTSNAPLLIKIPGPVTIGASPSMLSLVGPEKLQSGAKATFSATLRLSDGSLANINPQWSSANPVVAAISSNGVLYAGKVSVDTPVVLTASFTQGAITVKASVQVLIVAAKASLSGLRLVGPATVQSGGQTRLVLVAQYGDGSVRTVPTGAYTLTSSALGNVNSRGVLSVARVSEDAAVSVTANFTDGGITKSDTLTMVVSAIPATLERLTLVGSRGTLASNQTLALTALGVYDDGSRKVVDVSWSVSGDAATISSAGVLTAKAVAGNAAVVVKASYTEGAVTVRTKFQILVQATAAPSVVQAEVQTTGTSEDFGLSFWSSLDLATLAASQPALGAVARGHSVAATTTQGGYQMYVLALIPSGPAVSVNTIFMLNRNSEWQLAGFPLAEYLAGVADNSFQLIELFDHLDASLITGTQIFVGYGITDTEMLESGRYKLVYQVQ